MILTVFGTQYLKGNFSWKDKCANLTCRLLPHYFGKCKTSEHFHNIHDFKTADYGNYVTVNVESDTHMRAAAALGSERI